MNYRGCPSAAFLSAVRNAAEATAHPFGGVEFRRRGEAVCFARLLGRDWDTAEISGMFSATPGGGRHAMALICFLADLHEVRLTLVAASIIPSRMDTPALVAWYRRLGFVPLRPDGAFMERQPRTLVRT